MRESTELFLLHYIALILASHSIAFLTTFFRLVHRFKTRRLWWDDFWAFIALLSDLFVWIIFMVITINLLVITPNGKHLRPTFTSTPNQQAFGRSTDEAHFSKLPIVSQIRDIDFLYHHFMV